VKQDGTRLKRGDYPLGDNVSRPALKSPK